MYSLKAHTLTRPGFRRPAALLALIFVLVVQPAWGLDADDEITLDSANDTPRTIWGNATTIWVADNDDTIYAYGLLTGERDSSNDFGTVNGAGRQGTKLSRCRDLPTPTSGTAQRIDEGCLTPSPINQEVGPSPASRWTRTSVALRETRRTDGALSIAKKRHSAIRSGFCKRCLPPPGLAGTAPASRELHHQTAIAKEI